MHKTTLVLLLGLIFSSYNSVFGQNDFARIEKNRNIRAESLYHDLNKTKDTLILSSSSKIGYVYSINREYQREIDTYIFDYECKIPLTNLSKGKHVFAVGHMSMAIVFVIYKLEDNRTDNTIVAELQSAKINSDINFLETNKVSDNPKKSRH
ncbi:hypothetical protein [Winogradskyella sp. A3E31]|uniref:hypothetical protein n=1 Tax=Winogradskyella sp. A3E31 TaxID=3349637 RepID=UPI00398ADB7F